MKTPYKRKQYWNEPTMSAWELAYLPEILRGLSITSGVFLRNMWRWITGRKGALTTYYPEETRFDYAPLNRGKHVLTQRPDGKPQCIACNLCATVCPAKVIEIEAGFDPTDTAHPKYPVRFEIDYSRCIFCGLCVEVCPEDAIRMAKETPGLPSDGRHQMWLTLDEMLTWKPQRDVAKPYSAAGAHKARERAMIETLLLNVDTLLLLLFALCALVGAALMIVLRQPMRVAMALISTMVFLGAIYGLLGVHFIAAFQVLIYVGAVMVFMVYVIMLLEVRESGRQRYSKLLLPGVAGFVLLLGVIVISIWRSLPSPVGEIGDSAYGIAKFSVTFLNDYWLHFEITSVLLVAAVVAALAVIKVSRRARHG